MARIRNEKLYAESKSRLLDIGIELIRQQGFSGIGINDVLKAANIPRGSFYHYFDSKETFGLEVAQHYHDQQLSSARGILGDSSRPGLERLASFFDTALEEFRHRNFKDGCLMCNLSTEMADLQPSFQVMLSGHWQALATPLAECLESVDKSEIGLGHLTNKEAADWLLNAWSGALTRMKADGNDAALSLFMKTVFRPKAADRGS